MKKLIIAALVIGSATAMWAQGDILMKSTSSKVSFGSIYPGDTYAVGDYVPPTFSAQLLYEGNVIPETVKANAFGKKSSGEWNGRLAVSGSIRVDSLEGGSTINLVLQAFDADGHYFGESEPFEYTTGVPGSIDPTQAAVALKFTSFTVEAVPEPTTIALGLIGLTGLMFIRRRH